MLATTALYESGRRDLNSTAPMRGRCFIGTYVHEMTASVGTGTYGPANITANKRAHGEVRRGRVQPLLFAPSQETIHHGIEAVSVIDKQGVARILEEFQS